MEPGCRQIKKYPDQSASGKRKHDRGISRFFPLVPSPICRLMFPFLNRAGVAGRLLPSSEGLTANDKLNPHIRINGPGLYAIGLNRTQQEKYSKLYF